MAESNNRFPTRREDSFWSLRDAMDQLFDESFLMPLDRTQTPLSRTGSLFPKIDVSENKKTVTVEANVPGVNEEDIELEADEHSLLLSGTIERTHEDDGEQGYRYEREYGSFRRSIPLPSEVDPQSAKASYKNGVLTVTLEKQEENRRQKIAISGKE